MLMTAVIMKMIMKVIMKVIIQQMRPLPKHMMSQKQNIQTTQTTQTTLTIPIIMTTLIMIMRTIATAQNRRIMNILKKVKSQNHPAAGCQGFLNEHQKKQVHKNTCFLF